jgi:hypothetical protein
LDILGEVVDQWMVLHASLINSGIKLKEEEDKIIWGANPNLSIYLIKLGYPSQFDHSQVFSGGTIFGRSKQCTKKPYSLA